MDYEKKDLDPNIATSAKLTSLTDEQIRDAELAFSKAGNRKLSDVVTEQLHWRQVLKGKPINTVIAEYSVFSEMASEHGFSIRDAVDYYKLHYKAPIKSIKLTEALEKFLEVRNFKNRNTRANYVNSIRVITSVYPDILVHDVTLEHLDETLGKKNVGSQLSHRGRISTFFRWAKNHNYCAENIRDRLSKISDERTPAPLLSLEGVKRMLKVTLLIHKPAVPTIVLGLFGGLRPSEIVDLTESNFSDGRITIVGGKLRNRSDRIIEMPEVLVAWLEKYPFKEKVIIGRNVFRKIAEATGEGANQKNIRRHTAISYHYSLYNAKVSAADYFGTSVKMINKHYLNTDIPKADAVAYWQLTPDQINNTSVEQSIPKGKKRIQYPDDQTLAAMVRNLPMTNIAKQLGCSDNAIRKHCRKRGIGF